MKVSPEAGVETEIGIEGSWAHVANGQSGQILPHVGSSARHARPLSHFPLHRPLIGMRIAQAIATVALSSVVLVLGSCAGGSVQPTPETGQDEGGAGNIASLSEVIGANPNSANAYNLRGTAYGQQGRYDEALADLNRALEINPKFYQAYNNRAVVFMRLSRAQEAMADYDKVINIAPDYQTAYVGRGKLHMQSGRQALALADFNKAIQLDSNDPVAYYNRALIYQAQGKHLQAEEDLTLAVGFRPKTIEPYLARGKSRYAMRKYKAAAEDFAVVVERDEKHFEAWTWRGFAFEKMGDRDKAANAYKWALHIKPGHEPAEQGLQRIGVQRGPSWRRPS